MRFKQWFLKEIGAGVGVPYVGQAPDKGHEMSWQGAPSGGKLHSAGGDVPMKHSKHHKRKKK